MLILVGAKITWEEDGFQFGFKRWQGWAVSKVLWKWIPNDEGSQARENAKVISLAFVLLEFQHEGTVSLRSRAYCTSRNVDMLQFRDVSKTRTIYNTDETHTSDFILNTFWNGIKLVPHFFYLFFLQERCWVVVAGCQENDESSSKSFEFSGEVGECMTALGVPMTEETVVVVKPWDWGYTGSNKSWLRLRWKTCGLN